MSSLTYNGNINNTCHKHIMINFHALHLQNNHLSQKYCAIGFEFPHM